jgi:hypothetical protein
MFENLDNQEIQADASRCLGIPTWNSGTLKEQGNREQGTQKKK